MNQVFVYGTLMNREVVYSLLGSNKITYSDVLEGHRKSGLNILEEEGAEVHGVTFDVTDEELGRLDAYEGVEHNLYRRKEVTLASGETAWVYQKCNPDQVVFARGEVG